jgi:hypothetical protein
VWQYIWIPLPIKAIAATKVGLFLKENFEDLAPIWGVIYFLRVRVAMPVGKQLMSPVFEQMTRGTPCIDLENRTDKLNGQIMAIGNTQLTLQP